MSNFFRTLAQIGLSPFYAVIDMYIHIRDGVSRILMTLGLRDDPGIVASPALSRRRRRQAIREQRKSHQELRRTESRRRRRDVDAENLARKVRKSRSSSDYSEELRGYSKGEVVNHLLQVNRRASQKLDTSPKSANPGGSTATLQNVEQPTQIIPAASKRSRQSRKASLAREFAPVKNDQVAEVSQTVEQGTVEFSASTSDTVEIDSAVVRDRLRGDGSETLVEFWKS